MNVVKQPDGPNDFFHVTKRTALLIAICILSALFMMGFTTLLSYHAYTDARGDLGRSNASTECARQINADTVVAQGEFSQGLGALAKQIATVFKALPTIQTTPAEFQSALAGFKPIEQELNRLNGLMDQALTRQSQVVAACRDPKGD